jgi:hypothetical protein
MRICLFFPLVSLFLACSHDQKVNSELGIIDIAYAFENQQEVKLSKFVDTITYIPMELNAESFISDYPVIKVEDYIIVRNTGPSNTPLLLFDKSNGNFIRFIGKIGRGPGEYTVPAKDFYNVYNKLIYTHDYNLGKIKILDINGRFLESFNTPEITEPSNKGGKLRVLFSTYLDKDTYLSYTDNFNGVIKTKLVIYNKDRILKIFPNFLQWGNKDVNKNHRPSFNPCFIRWSNNLYFKEMFNDTLFCITKESLIPRFIFNYGQYGLPYEQQDRIMPSFGQLSYDYFLVNDIYENSDFLFFRLFYDKKEYSGFYDKKAKTTTVCKPIGDSTSALTNDIIDFMPFVWKGFTQKNELISILDPTDILKWLKNNPEKSQKLEEKMVWLKTISETSNPVIVIAKCKR